MESVTLHSSKEEIFKALRRIGKRLNLEQGYSDGNTLCFEKAGSLLSYGNFVECKIYKYGDRYKITVNSNSASIQIVDWGTNSNIESSIVDELRDSLA